MRFNIKDYEKVFPRQAEPVAVKFAPDDKVDSVIEGSSEDDTPDTPAQEPENDIKIYTGPEKPNVTDPEGGEQLGDERDS